MNLEQDYPRMVRTGQDLRQDLIGLEKTGQVSTGFGSPAMVLWRHLQTYFFE